MGHRYIGTKTRILGEIINKISSIAPRGSHVVDLMCGTATVSSILRDNGYRVTANDVMTFSYHHARVALLFTSSPTFNRAKNLIPQSSKGHSPYEKMIDVLNNVPSKKGYFWKEYCFMGKPRNTEKPRNYFSPENAMKIDGIRDYIKKIYKSKMINSIEHSLLLHDLIMAANDIANIAGTYGHYLSKLAGRAKSKIELKPSMLNIKKDHGKHTVIRGYAEDIAHELECDLCYIDPPYMKRQYAANYHILETLAREDEPDAIGASGLRPWRDQYSNFCTKTKIRDSFRKIFDRMDCEDFLISYSEDGLLKIGELKKFFSKFGKVKVYSLCNKRFKSNESKLKSKLIEYLIHLEAKR